MNTQKLWNGLSWLIIGAISLTACAAPTGPAQQAAIANPAPQQGMAAAAISNPASGGGTNPAAQTAEAASETLNQDPVDDQDQTVLAAPLDYKKLLQTACDRAYNLTQVLDLRDPKQLGIFISTVKWIEVNCKEWYVVDWSSNSGQVEITPKSKKSVPAVLPPVLPDVPTPTATPTTTPTSTPTSTPAAAYQVDQTVLNEMCLAFDKLVEASPNKTEIEKKALLDAQDLENTLGCK